MDKEKSVYIGDVIKRLRNEKGLTQEELALKSNIDRSYMSELERNLKSPSFTTIVKLSIALEEKAEYIVSESLKDFDFEEFIKKNHIDQS